MTKSKIIFFLIFLIYPFFSYSHVNHYDKFKIIKMDVFRNGKKIGYNKYLFKKQSNLLIVKNEINFAAKLISLLTINELFWFLNVYLLYPIFFPFLKTSISIILSLS